MSVADALASFSAALAGGVTVGLFAVVVTLFYGRR